MPRRVASKLGTARSPPAPEPSAKTPTARVDAFCIVGIGASAGGLDACRKLVAALPMDGGMAFILVQHLDPTHESLLVDLLADHSAVPVEQAADGMPIEPDHLYVIPPGTYLSVDSGLLRVSEPQARHGARLPFDFLLHSLAEDYAERAVAIVLSGTGADGSDGLRAIKGKSGLVIAQDPDEAGYDGMPRSAIATGDVDLVLPVAAMPDALAKYQRRLAAGHQPRAPHAGSADWLATAVALLRAGTGHDFTLYKEGTLRRRIERRMGLAAIEPAQAERYIDLLRTDPHELDLLAKDLLINVTGFFRDPKVFAVLEEKVIPDLLRSRSSDPAIRLWVAGCSSGEETYSLVMIFREAIEKARLDVKLQVFASDVDADAHVAAREGFYGLGIDAQISPARLTRFFSKEEQGYRVTPELRAAVVFTVQDVLADPPFSRLDMISCRNLLIYLKPEAQAKVLSLFHFALREGGLLLLGNAETAGHVEGRFEVVSKPARV
jgi:two-component system CheB/CheR fusion protein